MNQILYYSLSIVILKFIVTDTKNVTENGIHIKIYDNIAEISQPISAFDLPRTYSQRQWNDIRADSFRLIGDYVNIHAQIISYDQTSLNGQKILIQRSTQNDTFTEAIMIDDTRNLIHDLVDNTYYTIGLERIRFFSIPPARNYFVNFVFDTSHVEQLYLRYLQSNIKWTVRYDLLLEMNDTDSILQAYANIRNDGSSLLIINSAELISGDVNIQAASSAPSFQFQYNFGNAGSNAMPLSNDQSAYAVTTTPAPMISSSQEIAGIYMFSINETFVLDPQSNYILPMFRPVINIERYGIIERYFRAMDNRGYAKRAYRLRVPDKYLPRGHVFVRESDRLVGEIYWSDHSANETNEFNLGEDPDLQFIEYVQLNSRRQAYEANGYRFTLSTYTITLHLFNNKKRSMNIEYRLRFSSQDNLTLKENTNDTLIQVDGSSIIGTFLLNANDKQETQFTFETQ